MHEQEGDTVAQNATEQFLAALNTKDITLAYEILVTNRVIAENFLTYEQKVLQLLQTTQPQVAAQLAQLSGLDLRMYSKKILSVEKLGLFEQFLGAKEYYHKTNRKVVLEIYAQLMQKDAKGDLPLLVFIQNINKESIPPSQKIACLNILLVLNAKLDSTNADGLTATHIMFSNGEVELIKFLLNQNEQHTVTSLSVFNPPLLSMIIPEPISTNFDEQSKRQLDINKANGYILNETQLSLLYILYQQDKTLLMQSLETLDGSGNIDITLTTSKATLTHILAQNYDLHFYNVEFIELFQETLKNANWRQLDSYNNTPLFYLLDNKKISSLQIKDLITNFSINDLIHTNQPNLGYFSMNLSYPVLLVLLEKLKNLCNLSLDEVTKNNITILIQGIESPHLCIKSKINEITLSIGKKGKNANAQDFRKNNSFLCFSGCYTANNTQAKIDESSYLENPKI